MRLLIYGINYAPERTGVGKYTAEMAEWLQERGHQVRVVTAPPYYPAWKVGAGYRGWAYVRESVHGVEVCRCPLWVPRRPSGGTRLLHLLSFAVSSIPVMIAQIFWRPDLVFVIEPTLLCAPAALIAARLSDARSWLHIQDYEVEAFFGLGFSPRGRAARFVAAVEGWLMRRFDRVSSISREMVARLSAFGVPPDRATWFPNWVDTKTVRPGARGRDFHREWGLANGSRIVLYAGSMGEKQGLAMVLQTAKAMEDSHRSVVFLLVGDGSAKEDLVEKARKTGLRNVMFRPPQPSADFPALLALADVHLVVQKKGVADAFLPSKLTGILAAGGTAIITADEDTELGRLVNENPGIAVLVPPEDPVRFREALRASLANDEDRAARNDVARNYAGRYLAANVVLSRLEAMLATMAERCGGQRRDAGAMLKQQARLFNKLTLLADLVVIFTAFYVAHHLTRVGGEIGDIRDYTWVLLIVLPVWYVLLAYFDMYYSLRTRSLTDVLFAVLKIHVAGAILTSSCIYLVAPQGVSRVFFVFFVVASLALMSVEKTAVKMFLSAIRKRGYNFRHILIVGDNDRARRVARVIEQHAGWGLKLVGFLRDGSSGPGIDGHPSLGEVDDVADFCMRNAVDEAVFCLPKEQWSKVDQYQPMLEEMGVTVRLVLDLGDSRPHRKMVSYLHDEIPMFTYYGKPFDAGHLFLKRCLDVSGALVGLGLTALLFPFIALAIKLDSPGPLFFRQARVGENGRLFTCWKFRSMYHDAEGRKRELISLNEMNGAIFKIKNDPRITRVGRFLRRLSLDELPQFWNVLRGEMSLVGTRPPTPDEVAGYEYKHRKRICIKPGITGLWQVSGRNEIRNFEDVVRLDIEYIDKWTLWLDVKILMKTFWVLLVRNGAF